MLSVLVKVGVKVTIVPELDRTTVSGGGLVTDVGKATRTSHENLDVDPLDTLTDPTDTCKRAHIPLKTGKKVHPAVTLILLGIGLEAIFPVTTID